MELRQFLITIRKWLWLIVLSTAVATLASFLATRQQAAIYSANTVLMVGRTIQDPNPNTNEVWVGQQLAQTYAEIAKQQIVRDSTREALGLSWLPEYSVALVPNTQLLRIQVEDTNPQRAALVADQLAHQLIEQSPSATEKERQDRREFVSQQLLELETNIEETKVRVADLQEQLAGMFSARQIADTQTQINALDQKLNNYQANYASLLGFLEGGVNTLQVVQPATVPTVPIGPNKPMTILLAAAVGFLLALGAAFLMDYLDDTIKNPDDIKAALGVTTLGAITVIQGDAPKDRLVTAYQAKSPISEAFRILRTNIQFSALDNPPRTLLVTSSNPGEGKSTTLANLGVVMAQQGQRVIMVDTDLRRPSLHRIFGLPNNVGLTNALLQSRPSIDGLLADTPLRNLRLLTTGPLPPNPAELLASERFGALIEELKGEADVVLFDSPPALAVTDAAIIGRKVDGVLVVVNASTTRRQAVMATREALSNVGANILGAVINWLKLGSGDYNYYYYYYYAYYSNYGEYAVDGTNGNKPRRLRPRSKQPSSTEAS